MLRNALGHAFSILTATRAVASRRLELFPPRRTFSLLHKEIKQSFNFRNGFFFEVGANDGLTYSNTAYLGRYLGWTGILVEAVPHKFVECARNRPDARTYHAALVPRDFQQPYLEIAYADLMSVTRLSDLNVAEHTARGAAYIRGESGIFQQVFLAPARTAQAVIDDAGNPKIDLFSLDVEGAEMSVLAGIDFSRTRPRYFLIELRDLEEAETLLNKRGYRLERQFGKLDYLFRDASCY